VVLAAASFSVAGCGSSSAGGNPSAPNLSVVRAARDVPRVTFNGCLIPAGQPTWANILLTGAKGNFRDPFRAVWSVDGKVDTSDPQRTIAAPGKGTRLELLVRLGRAGARFQIEVFNARGFVGGYSFTNTAASGVWCKRDGRPAASKP
jgi:hypothetical protein